MALFYFILEEVECEEVDEVDEVMAPDPLSVMTQDVKGHKVLATPAVRRVASENKVVCFILLRPWNDTIK